MDDHAGGELAARTLLDRGFTRIGGIFKRDDRQGHERFRGVCDGLAQSGKSLPDDQVCWFGTESRDTLFQEEDTCRLMEEIAGGKGPEAIVCYNDEVALGLCAALRERGARCPGT